MGREAAPPETLAIDPDRSDLVEIEDKDSYLNRGDPAVHTEFNEYP